MLEVNELFLNLLDQQLVLSSEWGRTLSTLSNRALLCCAWHEARVRWRIVHLAWVIHVAPYLEFARATTPISWTVNIRGVAFIGIALLAPWPSWRDILFTLFKLSDNRIAVIFTHSAGQFCKRKLQWSHWLTRGEVLPLQRAIRAWRWWLILAR